MLSTLRFENLKCLITSLGVIYSVLSIFNTGLESTTNIHKRSMQLNEDHVLLSIISFLYLFFAFLA